MRSLRSRSRSRQPETEDSSAEAPVPADAIVEQVFPTNDLLPTASEDSSNQTNTLEPSSGAAAADKLGSGNPAIKCNTSCKSNIPTASFLEVFVEDESVPVKRKPGRPKGSKNKRNLDTESGVPVLNATQTTVTAKKSEFYDLALIYSTYPRTCSCHEESGI